MQAVTHFLNYAASNPNAKIIYCKSAMLYKVIQMQLTWYVQTHNHEQEDITTSETLIITYLTDLSTS